MKVIPIYIEAGISGFESPAAEYKELGLSLDELLMENRNATFIGIANGRSMENIGIFEGDILLVDRSMSWQQHDVVVANLNGCFVCKLLDIRNTQLVSASDSHEPVKITPSDDFQIEGVVTRSIRMHRPAPELASCML